MDDVQTKVEANRRHWEQRTPVHLASRFYDVHNTEVDRLAPFEWAELGDVSGLRIAHLQCHLGTDTRLLARAGARMTGLDFSEASVAAARELAGDLDISYVRADVHDAVAELGGGFDMVYTGKGSLMWLPDLDRWAEIVRDLLAPGGRLYLVEFHPLAWTLNADFTIVGNYLDEAIDNDSARTYTDGPALAGDTANYQWNHALGTVVTALSRAGLRIAELHEHPMLAWDQWPGMVPDETSGWWRLPADRPRIPLTYSLTAVR
ncbi:class I SAM-dependent methyltransferase [Kutzneria sp. NPDC052558]|uniref:class I SAM-dependent methyltransferase n=1 Tax=Kutzneria sp. NPDC052558 TaxID=3364121 RepID=UPI0037C51D25